jgi:polyisoprenoid-binding protein YceI
MMKVLTIVFVSLVLSGAAIVSLLPKTHVANVPAPAVNDPRADVVRFRLDPAKSTFICHADRTGLAYFKGHSHRVGVKDFDGEATMSLDSVTAATLTMNIRAGSLEETDPFFTPQQKGIINGELNKIVLETAKYPDITFKSTGITGSMKNGAFDVQVSGNIMLHGVTRPITIPATVTVNGDTFRAQGHFSLNRKDFGVKATEAFHGFVKVKHVLKFEFDIIGERA